MAKRQSNRIQQERLKSVVNVSVVPLETIERKIYLIRNRKVLLDQDLAELYDVKPKALVQAVKRNLDRFPDDFMFQLTSDDAVTICDRIETKHSVSPLCIHSRGRCHAIRSPSKQAGGSGEHRDHENLRQTA